LIDRLKEEDLSVRQEACRLLDLLGADARAAIPALRTALADRDLRVAAADALWSIEPGNAETVPALIQQLQVGNTAQCLAAAKVLGRLGSDAAPALLPLSALLLEVGDRLQSEKLPEEEKLATAMPTEDEELAVAVLTAFRNFGPGVQDVVPAIAARVRCPDRPKVFHAAVETVGLLGPEARTSVPSLLAVLPQVSGRRRSHVAAALANMGPAGRPAIPALIGLLRDEETMTRFWAARALGNIGPEASQAIPELACLLSMAPTKADPTNVQDEAFSALEKIGPAAISALEAAQDNADSEVRCRAQTSLKRIREKAR
jgi:HEAT repeat protein